MNILDVLGPNWSEIKLRDSEVPFGGISYHGETLENFMADAEIEPEDSIGKLQKTLKDCGIMQIPIADSKIEELIQQKIWDIEENLGIKFCNYTWDYKEF